MTTPLHYKTAGQMLDEPAAGLNEEESEQLIHLIREFREPSNLGCDILIVEHDLGMIMRLCDRVHVLSEWQTLAEGPPDEIRKNPAVIECRQDNAGCF